MFSGWQTQFQRADTDVLRDSNNNNNVSIYQLMMSSGLCRASLVFPERSILSILVRPANTVRVTSAERIIITETRPKAPLHASPFDLKSFLGSLS